MKPKTLLSVLILILSTLHFDAAAEKLNPTDLTYLGAFKVPTLPIIYGNASNDGYPSGLSYRSGGDPGGDQDGFPGSLFFSNQFKVGEITIPKPVISSDFTKLNQATQIQSTNDVTGGKACSSCDFMGGVAYLDAKGSQTTPKLYWTAYEYYNVDSTDYNSIGWSEITLQSLNAQGSWHVGPPFSTGGQAYHGNKYGDYIFPVDQEWAEKNLEGRSLLVGRFREGGTYNGSSGPVLTAIAPWEDGNPKGTPPPNGASLSATPLMYFANNPSTSWNKFRILNDPYYTYFSAQDKWNGGAWVQKGGKKAIVIVGRHGSYDGTKYTDICKIVADGNNGCVLDSHGYGPHCYGFGGTDCPGPIATNNYKGIHTGPYYPTILFIDPEDLVSGEKSHNEVGAYASYNPSKDFVFIDPKGDNHLGGVAYDSINGLLYIMQSNVYRPGGLGTTPYPIIHVYQVGELTSPTNLRLINYTLN